MIRISQELLHKLDTHFDKISAMYSEGHHLEEIREHLDLSDSEMQQIEEVMFATNPYYTVKDIDGNKKVMQFNAHTLQSKEVRIPKETMQWK